ncbi:MAG TPA: hypothetical protein VGL60_03215 [Acidimicrobiales bacterium]|jgi:hypothetical protein
MTAQSAEAVELLSPSPEAEWATLDVLPARTVGGAAPDRRERRAQRQRARRERTLWAAAGLGFVALVFVAAVVVLDVLH